ncbi:MULTISPECIES: HEAT repeat domain-containing protein [unclassified Leptolyngbya]|uniref:HEAT repeat domain-containing protein n=1 Tax=unclassified Leptolyngbya TaxID=2650499 RepID=UPI001682E403|nr:MULTISPECIES: HEAT repeat domain-containing protein [unclassified Leptolyngbya]MBD1910816.1 HEAT repeat domain-containing protein [Leptolyngbya sp. FACHB-8]MBD2157615.1 HEAT repeat domain-containing protein [Leptolyngbya sp. FACHB-16]
MAKSRKLEELMTALNQIRSDPTSAEGMALLRQVLGSKYSVAIAQAAQLIGEHEIDALIPDLTAAFPRFMVKPQDSDPGCRAKQAIAETLYRFNYSDETLFLSGIRHVQMEPVWGGQVDTAPRLRGTCALGLVRMNYSQVMVELGDLLADRESEARIGAARAIAYSGNDQGIPLLRLRIKVGDNPPVISECLTALLQLAPTSSLSLAQELLYARNDGRDEHVELAEATALALGESRLPEAFELLRDWWKQVRDRELRRSGLLAIATLRQIPAFDFLISLILEGLLEDAKSAIKALSIYQQDASIWERVCLAVDERQDVNLKQALVKLS